jgi:hypothetical protein
MTFRVSFVVPYSTTLEILCNGSKSLDPNQRPPPEEIRKENLQFNIASVEKVAYLGTH